MRVVYITDGMASSVNASLELSRRLSEAGHDVVYLSPADVADTVGVAGYSFRLLAADREFVEASDPVGWRGIVRPTSWIGAVQRRRELKRQSIENGEIAAIVAELAPDVLLIDFEMHYARFATAPLGIPTFLTTVFFSVFRRPGLLPLDSTGSPVTASPLAQRAAWWRHRLATRRLEWRQRFIRTARADWFRPARYKSMDVDTLRAVARHHGVSPRTLGRHDWQRPFTHPAVPMLSFNLEELEFPHRPAPNLHYVGPMVRPPSSHRPNEDWDRFRRSRDATRPLVYCSLGTYWAGDQRFLQRVVRGFEHRPEWDLVIGLGGTVEPSRLSPLSDNVLVLRHAPQTAVLEVAAACITHGGATTLAECVANAVPVLVYSTGHVDQNGNAARVAHHRIGVIGSADDTEHEMIEQVSRLLADPELHERLDRLRSRVEATRGDALDIIERATRGPNGVARPG